MTPLHTKEVPVEIAIAIDTANNATISQSVKKFIHIIWAPVGLKKGNFHLLSTIERKKIHMDIVRRIYGDETYKNKQFWIVYVKVLEDVF